MRAADRQVTPWRQGYQESRWPIAVELALIAAVFVADEYHYIFFSKTPYLLALGWLWMLLRGQRWRDIGLSVPSEWRRLLSIGVAAGIAMELLELFATQPLLVALTGKYPDLSAFHDLIGNVPLLLLTVGASWILAGFGEELVWRGYILNRVADLLGRSRLGWAISIGIVSVVFGLAHSYQDWTGIIENSIDGALLALLYIACSRNLIAPIVAHGVTDTVDSLIIFSGNYPGMH
jgi:membrane protease YdiL (CAAX protease family)